MFCKFPKHVFHDWSKWEVIEKGVLLRTNELEDPVGERVVQERKCTRCNLLQRNVISTFLFS